jgi:hypothetical protein
MAVERKHASLPGHPDEKIQVSQCNKGISADDSLKRP